MATQLAASIATGQLTQAMQLKAMHDLPLNEEEYASLISLAGAADNWQLAVSLLRERDEQGLGFCLCSVVVKPTTASSVFRGLCHRSVNIGEV